MYIALAYDRTIKGKEYKADDVVQTDFDTASDLLNRGLARKASKPKRQPKASQTERNDD